MSTNPLLAELLRIEEQILELKGRFPRPTRFERFAAGFKSGLRTVTTYWVLFALLVGLFVNWFFGVGVFEDIKNRSITKKSSNYYFKIGDHLMKRAEFTEAAQAFAKSLEINPSNIDAQHGLMKAQVLQPIGEGQEISPAAVETKLAYLRDIFGPLDPILLYWYGMLSLRQSAETGDLERPQALFQSSLGFDSLFVGSRLELGNTFMFAGEIEKAEHVYEELHRIDGRYAPALFSLGYCRLVMATFEPDMKKRSQLITERAVKHLWESGKIAPRPEAYLHLGDAYLFSGQYDAAKVSHLNAAEMLKATKTDGDGSAQFNLPLLFLPLHPQDAKDRGPAVFIGSKEELEACVYYSLSFVHAMKRDFKKAESYFSEASARDPHGNHAPLMAHKMTSLVGLLQPERRVKRWFARRIESLCKGRDGCRPEALQATD